MNKNTEYYYQAAKKYCLSVERIEDIETMVVKLGRKNYYFLGAHVPMNNQTGALIACDKYYSNVLMERSGIPVPKAAVIDFQTYSEELLEEIISDLKFPLVAKPNFLGQGTDVLCNVQSMTQLKQYLEENLQMLEYVTVEEFHSGLNSYRVLVHNKRILGIVFREPAYVLGDGLHTIEELIEITNQKRAIINDALKPIEMDEECRMRLAEQNLTLNHIPDAEEKIKLGYTSNASRGGFFKSLENNCICSENRNLMINISKLFGLSLIGVDIECEDIGRPITSTGGVIIEVNHNPSIKIHENPLEGRPRTVAKIIMRSLILKHPFAYMYTQFVRALRTRKSPMYLKILALISILISLPGILSRFA